MIPISLYIKDYFWSYVQKYYKFLYYFLYILKYLKLTKMELTRFAMKLFLSW